MKIVLLDDQSACVGVVRLNHAGASRGVVARIAPTGPTERDDKPSRSEAIRRVVELGLKAKVK
jgi:hypothetical protein